MKAVYKYLMDINISGMEPRKEKFLPDYHEELLDNQIRLSMYDSLPGQEKELKGMWFPKQDWTKYRKCILVNNLLLLKRQLGKPNQTWPYTISRIGRISMAYLGRICILQ